MKKTIRRISGKLIALSLSLSIGIAILTACGSQNSDSAYIKNRGKLIVGVTEFQPLDYQTNDGWQGFDAELARSFAKRLGVEAEIVEINWNTKEVELAAKTIDCIWNGLTYSEERAQNMGLTKAYLLNRQSLVVPIERSEQINSLADLAGLSVAAESGSSGEEVVKDKLAENKYIEKNAQIDALTEVALGTADAAVVDSVLADYITSRDDGSFSKLKPMPQILDEAPVPYVVAFRKDSDLVKLADTFFDQQRQSGELQKLAEQFVLTENLVK